MNIDLQTNVSLMDVSAWHDNVDDTTALMSERLPNQEIAEWLLRIREAAPTKEPMIIKGKAEAPSSHVDVIRCNQLLKLLANDLLRRFCVLTTDANVQKVIDEYERHINVY